MVSWQQALRNMTGVLAIFGTQEGSWGPRQVHVCSQTCSYIALLHLTAAAAEAGSG